jgi:hypothetical protein
MLSTEPLDLRLQRGDLFVGPDGFEFVSGIDGAAQLCEIALKLFLGEWFLNQQKGMPWYQSILGDKPNLDDAKASAVAVLRAVPTVVSVSSVTASVDKNRRLSMTASVKTEFGDVTIPREGSVP